MISSPFGCANTLLEDLRRRDTSRTGDFRIVRDSKMGP